MCVRKTASKGFGRILKKTNVSIYKENNNASNLIEIPVRPGLPCGAIIVQKMAINIL